MRDKTYEPSEWDFDEKEGLIFYRSGPLTRVVIASMESGDDEEGRLIAAAPALLKALKAFVDEYVELVNSGDAGFWNPEEESKVIAARAAISKAEGR